MSLTSLDDGAISAESSALTAVSLTVASIDLVGVDDTAVIIAPAVVVAVAVNLTVLSTVRLQAPATAFASIAGREIVIVFWFCTRNTRSRFVQR